jgi:hypothetical protein
LGEFSDEPLQPPQDSRVARRGGENFIDDFVESFGVEAGGKAFEAQRSELPIAVATRAPEQIDLSGDTLVKCVAQLCQQLGIIPCGSGEGRVESTGFESHGTWVGDEG